MFIYKITNVLNNKIYIGKTTKTIEKRFKKHIYDAFNSQRTTKICNALRKYGVDAFKVEQLCECQSLEELNEKEIYYIALYDTQNIGYNISKGGDGGITPSHTNEKQIELFKARKGKTYEEIYGEERAKEIKRKMSIGEKGKKISNEQRIKTSIRSKLWWKEHYEEGCKKNQEIAKRGKEHHMYGKSHTQEAKKKISESKKGKTYEEIYGEEMANVVKEKMHNKMKGSNNPSYKNIDMVNVFNILLNEPYINLNMLAKTLGVTRVTLSNKIKHYLNVDNIQTLRYNTSEQELKILFNNTMNLILENNNGNI